MIVGGQTFASPPLADVIVVRVDDAGVVSTTTRPSGVPGRANGMATFGDGNLFIGGGASTFLRATYANGTVGELMVSGTMSNGIIVAGGAVFDERAHVAYFVGRPNGDDTTSAIGYSTPLGGNAQTLAISNINLVLSYGGVATANGWLYVLGGRNDSDGGVATGGALRVSHLESATNFEVAGGMPQGRRGFALVVGR